VIPVRYELTLALTSPTSGSRSVGIVRSRTKATELVGARFECLQVIGFPDLCFSAFRLFVLAYALQ
jgi:hypothetical protein